MDSGEQTQHQRECILEWGGANYWEDTILFSSSSSVGERDNEYALFSRAEERAVTWCTRAAEVVNMGHGKSQQWPSSDPVYCWRAVIEPIQPIHLGICLARCAAECSTVSWCLKHQVGVNSSMLLLLIIIKLLYDFFKGLWQTGEHGFPGEAGESIS